MVDRIEGVGGLQPIKGPKGERVEKSKGKVEKSDEIRTESKAVLDDLMERIKNEPEVREKLVEELKRALENGLYRIDPDEIAKRMLEGG